MAHPDSEIIFRIVLPASDLEDTDSESSPNDIEESIEAVTSAIIETANVLPNTEMTMDDDGNRTVAVTRGDWKQWGHIVEKVRQLTCEYERLVQMRECKEQQADSFSWDGDYRLSDD